VTGPADGLDPALGLDDSREHEDRISVDEIAAIGKIPSMKILAAALLCLAIGCASGSRGSTEGLGSHRRPIAAKSPEAQEQFDRGLAYLYAFNHDEAIRSFKKALEADPECAMAWWGIACANGPHINNPMVEPDRAKAAWEAIVAAKKAARSEVERDLIEAQSKRWSETPSPDRAALDKAYADAMREVWKRRPKDAEVGALFAEALMDLRPWDLWKQDGTPQPGTDEVLATLEAIMALNPNHPLALHLYIHAVEASPNPEKADAAADRLRELNPGLGHMVHMPSHIDVRRGRWKEAIEANKKAIAADARYRGWSPDQGFYHIYMAHNRHMLAFASMMRGQSAQATKAIAELVTAIPEDFIQAAAPFIDGFFSMPYEMHLRFGRWDAMLAEKEPREIFPLSRALWHYGRGTAFAAKGNPAGARTEQRLFEEKRKLIAKDQTFGNNLAADLAAVAEKLLEGEILYREGRTEEAFAALREAVAREDALRYDEPPDWIQPTRHILGAALLDAGRAAEAEAVYVEDLKRLPGNGWSLLGMARSLEAQGKVAASFRKEFEEAWRDADIKTTSSCLCLPGK
jgi:tetratricopeptide (TPR) repeat protein